MIRWLRYGECSRVTCWSLSIFLIVFQHIISIPTITRLLTITLLVSTEYVHEKYCLELSWFFLLYPGYAEYCSLSDLEVTQTLVSGQTSPLYLVTVENKCICTQGDVRLECMGFNSSVNIDPAGVITSDSHNGLCSLNGGQPVHNGETVTFNYAWGRKISFKPVESTIACSAAPSPAQ